MSTHEIISSICGNVVRRAVWSFSRLAVAEKLELPVRQVGLGTEEAQATAGGGGDEVVAAIGSDRSLASLGDAGGAELERVAVEDLDSAVGEDESSLGGDGEEEGGLHVCAMASVSHAAEVKKKGGGPYWWFGKI